MIQKKVFSVTLHTLPVVKTGIKNRLNASKISEILPSFISVTDCLAKQGGMVFSFSLLMFVRAALPRTAPEHVTESKFQRTNSYCISEMALLAQPQ